MKNFRNYKEKAIVFDPDTTLIIGPNTAGKSNILEAVYLLSNGKSKRADYDKDLIMRDQSLSMIACHYEARDGDQKLEVIIQSKDRASNLSSKTFKVNGVKRRFASFVGNLNSVLFTPEDLDIVTDSPGTRRAYLNTVLSQVHPEYRKAILAYSKVLRSRNKILEKVFERQASPKQLSYWDIKIVELAKIINSRREQFFEFVNQNIGSLTSDLFENGSLEIEYKSSKLTREVLNTNIARDIRSRTTTSGPHREDFTFVIQVNPGEGGPESPVSLHAFGSRSEQRSAILSLKLLELEYVEDIIRDRPVLLLDDIFSELDHKHRIRVLSLLGKQQTILTTADIHLVDESYRKSMEVIVL